MKQSRTPRRSAPRLFVRQLMSEFDALKTWEQVGLLGLLFATICVVQFVRASW